MKRFDHFLLVWIQILSVQDVDKLHNKDAFGFELAQITVSSQLGVRVVYGWNKHCGVEEEEVEWHFNRQKQADEKGGASSMNV